MPKTLQPARHKGIALTVLATLCWGGGMVLSKRSLSNTEENSLFLVQLISAWVCILVMTLVAGKLSLREWRHGWLGILEPGIAFYLGLIGLGRTTAINATILQAMEGLMIIALSFIFFRGRASRQTLFWGVLSTIGAVLATSKENIGLGVSMNSGDLLILLGTLFAAIYVTLSSRIVDEKNSAESLLFWQLSFCTVLVAAFLLFRGKLSLHAHQFDFFSVSSGALSYGLSFYFYLQGMKRIPTSLSAILLCLTPLFGVFFAVLFLSESISLQNVAGLVLVLISTILVTRETTA